MCKDKLKNNLKCLDALFALFFSVTLVFLIAIPVSWQHIKLKMLLFF